LKKVVKLLLLSNFYLVLFACNSHFKIPETVTIEGVSYRSGFYGDLFPVNFTYSNDYYEAKGNKFRRVNFEMFDLIEFANDGSTLDVLYCAESQWEQAYTYYMNRDNFVYYCRVGMPNIYIDPIIITISSIDHKKFDDLMVFSNENSYNPFRKNNNVITQKLPIPDKDESPQLVFYRKSNDGLFTSSEANKFHVINDKLWLVFFYDYGHGNYEELVAVTVPNELGQYFIGLLQLNRIKN
jgi:hypothetical protein